MPVKRRLFAKELASIRKVGLVPPSSIPSQTRHAELKERYGKYFEHFYSVVAEAVRGAGGQVKLAGKWGIGQSDVSKYLNKKSEPRLARVLLVHEKMRLPLAEILGIKEFVREDRIQVLHELPGLAEAFRLAHKRGDPVTPAAYEAAVHLGIDTDADTWRDILQILESCVEEARRMAKASGTRRKRSTRPPGSSKAE